MSSSSHSSSSSSSSGLDTMRANVRKILTWSTVGVATTILVVWLLMWHPWTGWNNPFSPPQDRQEATQTGPCDYFKHQTVFGNLKPEIPQNPGGSCGIDLFYSDNPGLYVQAAGSDVAEGPFFRGEDIPLDAEYIWSASVPFKGAFKLVAARYIVR